MFPINWSQLLFFEFIAIAVGLVIYHSVSYFYWRKYYLKRADTSDDWKCQPKRFLPEKRHHQAIRSGTMNMTLGGFLSGLLMYGIANGLPTKFYYELDGMGWPYLFLSAVGLFVIIDYSAYWVHRVLHFKFLYKRIHRFHHYFGAPTPWAAIALNPLELMALQAAAFLAMFIIPLHPAVFACVLIYILVFNIVDHSGVDLKSRIPWQAPSKYHDDHHVHFHVNFGQHLMIWDRLHGTLRRQDRKYGQEVFGGKGEPTVGTDPDAFVNY